MNRCHFLQVQLTLSSFGPFSYIFRQPFSAAPLPSICDTLALQRSKVHTLGVSLAQILNLDSLFRSLHSRYPFHIWIQHKPYVSPCLAIRSLRSMAYYPFSLAALARHLLQPPQIRPTSCPTMTSKRSFKWPPPLARPLMAVLCRPEIPEHSCSSVMYVLALVTIIRMKLSGRSF